MHSNAPTVLVVDDEKLIADTVVMILNSAGIQAHAVYSGEEAIEWAARNHPGLALLDVVMQGVHGVQAAIAIRELSPQTRILLFSGQAGTNDILEGARSQGYDFPILAKPVSPQELIAAVVDALQMDSAA
jgi:DNA-binding NtrC family response regulator